MTIKTVLESMNPRATVMIMSTYDDMPVISGTAYDLWKNNKTMQQYGGKHVIEIHAAAEETFLLYVNYFMLRLES